MSDRDVRERDILVAPNEFAYVQDLTKGDIVLYVGPTKISLSNTERLIHFRGGRFVPVTDDQGAGVHKLIEARSSQYIVLENPPKDPEVKPVKGANYAVELQNGRKVVVPGPAQFPLWPGQRAEVLDGHELRQDQYLVVRVYDVVPGDDSPIGTEKIIRGTEVSFYIPTTGLEVVPDRDGRYVRKAWRLDPNIGLHLRVVKSFEAGEGDQLPPGQYTAGQDLFLSGREGFFFPTSSVEVIEVVEPTPLAEKEGIYVRRFDTGAISTVEGPTRYLPDPTREEIVDREIDDEIAELYGIANWEPERALSIYVPPSTAVMVMAKNRREVVVGPQTRILEYDEELEVLTLSTGRPKSDERLLSTCFLQIEGNKVSDVVKVKTADHVELEVLLSYRVSFTGDADKWFNVKNYVGLLCDHLGSISRAAARSTSIEAFHASSAGVLRDAILGPRGDSGGREGRHFEENGLWVYDVEVLDVRILDADVERMLCDAQRRAIVSEITRKQQQLRLGDEKLKESVNQEIYLAQMATLERVVELEGRSRDAELARAQTRVDLGRLEKVSAATHDAEASEIRSRAENEDAERRAEIERRRLEARAASFRAQMESLQPELIATLKTMGNQELAAALSKNLSPLAILGGDSVADVATRLLEKLPLGGPKNGDIRALLATDETAE